MTETSFLTSLVSGGMAGMAVDISLFPLDTIKTRLQSKQGFWAAGGFKNIYSGKINLFTLLIFDHEISTTFDSYKKLRKSVDLLAYKNNGY